MILQSFRKIAVSVLVITMVLTACSAEPTATPVPPEPTEAPTEANFAPGGAAEAGLKGAAADARAAELHVLAIDPCVAAVVEIAEE